jgi:outer membrane protein TolC
LRAAWARAEQQLRRTRDAVLPQSSTAFDAARSAYVAGRGDFATVAEDFRLWLEARVELAEREADRFVTWAEIDALLAEPSLTTSPATPGGAR